MNNSIINFPLPANEPVKAYMPGSPERVALEKELERQSKLVVEIHEHLVVGHLDDLTLDAHAFLSHHGHAGTRTDILGVKLAVDMENLLLELIDQLGILYAESLMGLKGEIKFFALLQAHDMQD